MYCELGSKLLTLSQIAQHESYTSWAVNIKVKYTPTRMDLSREHVVFKLSCMVVKCTGAQLLQLRHYHNHTYLKLLLIARTKFSDFSDQCHYRKNKYSQLIKFQ